MRKRGSWSPPPLHWRSSRVFGRADAGKKALERAVERVDLLELPHMCAVLERHEPRVLHVRSEIDSALAVRLAVVPTVDDHGWAFDPRQPFAMIDTHHALGIGAHHVLRPGQALFEQGMMDRWRLRVMEQQPRGELGKKLRV